jgi:hypothetical protein
LIGGFWITNGDDTVVMVRFLPRQLAAAEIIVKLNINRRTQVIVVSGAVIAVLALIFVTQKHRFSVYLRKPMSVHDRVVNVVRDWASMSSRPEDKQLVEVVWATSGRSFAFYPDAAQVLTRNLQSEFRDSKAAVVRYTDFYAPDVNANGKVKTVGDLATAVRQNYEPQ